MTPTRRRAARAAAVLAAVVLLAAGWFGLRALDPPPPPAQPRLGPRTGPVRFESPEAAAGRSLDAVRVGMPRAEVEAVLGRPAADAVGPVVEADGRAVYHARYQMELDGPVWCAPDIRGACEAVLEYDAGRPGHPLLGVACTPIRVPVRIRAT